MAESTLGAPHQTTVKQLSGSNTGDILISGAHDANFQCDTEEHQCRGDKLTTEAVCDNRHLSINGRQEISRSETIVLFVIFFFSLILSSGSLGLTFATTLNNLCSLSHWLFVCCTPVHCS